MKYTVVVAFLVSLFVGCKENTLIDDTVFEESLYSVGLMENSVTSTFNPFAKSTSTNIPSSSTNHYDSTRHLRMLTHLQTYLSLTDTQFVAISAFANTMYEELVAIRAQVDSSFIEKDSAKVLVEIARTKFIDSIKTVLTEEQLVLFDTWVQTFWNRQGMRRGHGGRGHGHGGHGHGGRP